MKMPVKKILQLPVFTKSGAYLGKLIDLEIDIDSQVVLAYIVSRGFFRKKLFLIRPEQVDEITVQRVIVADATVSQFERSSENKIFDKSLAEPALNRESYD